MKVLLILGLIAAMATIAMTRNYTWGQRVSGDKLRLRKNFILPPKYGKYQKRTIKFDPLLMHKTITAIHITDRFKNSSGAEAQLIDGGVGKMYATIRLHSQYSQGIFSILEIYGK